MKKIKMKMVFCLLIAALAIEGIVPAAEKAESGISLLQEVKLGGVKQWILARGDSRSNPILLFLHGGPGFAEMPFAYIDSKELEKHYIVVNWDQRGCGKSFHPEIAKETFTLEQFLSDTGDLVKYLKKRFAKGKIFLVGHSWGSILGMHAIHRNPADFYAYVGMGQVVNSDEGERASYQYALSKARDANDSASVKMLEGIGAPPYKGYESTSTQRYILGKYQGVFGGRVTYPELLKMMNSSPDYTETDKKNFMAAFIQVHNRMWSEVMAVDLTPIQKVQIPVYFFLGKHDYSVPFEIAERYLDRLQAPRKEIVWFENSGHYPNLEEPEKYQDVLINKILKHASAK